MQRHFLSGLLLAAIAAVFFFISRQSYPLFHALIELVGVAFGLSIFFLTFHARRHIEKSALVLGTAYAFIGIVNVLHALAYKGMGLFPGYEPDLSTQLWLVIRALEAGAYLLAGATLRRTPPLPALFGGFAAAAAALVYAVASGLFPVCVVEGQGLTPFKIGAEYAAMAVLAAGGGLFWRRRALFDPEILRLLLGSVGLHLAAGLCFTLYADMYGPANFAGHMLRLSALLCLHRAVFVTGVATPYGMLSLKLRQAEEKFRSLVENSPEGLFQTTFEGEIFTANPALARALGYESPAQALGQHLWRHFPEGREDFRRLLLAALAQGSVERHEMRAERLSGQELWLALSLRCVDGEPRRVEGTLHDITPRKRAEEMRQSVERILQHELRSPLNGIVGLGELLRDNKALPAEAREMSGAMAEAGWRMLRMVEQTQVLQKLEEGNYRPESLPVDALPLLRRVCMWLVPTLEPRKVRVELRAAGEPLERTGQCVLWGDPNILEHMLANLVKNAAEAAPEEATVLVDCRDGAGMCQVSIHNPGAVPEPVRDRFFERYATYGKFKGTGLGTYIARLAALAHGGHIEFETSEEAGTTVRVLLPGQEPDRDDLAEPAVA